MRRIAMRPALENRSVMSSKTDGNNDEFNIDVILIGGLLRETLNDPVFPAAQRCTAKTERISV